MKVSIGFTFYADKIFICPGVQRMVLKIFQILQTPHYIYIDRGTQSGSLRLPTDSD